MKGNRTKDRLARGKSVLGVIAPNTDPCVAEMVGVIGFDCYIMDAEHGAIDPGEALGILRACEAVGITPLVRVPNLDSGLIVQFLDAGVMGIVLPGIQGVNEVAELVEIVKYPPLGGRGLGPIRASNYFLDCTSQEEYMSYANEQTLLLPQIESIKAVDCLDVLVEVKGIDGFIIGPRDLALSMGVHSSQQDGVVDEVIQRVKRYVLDSGLVLGYPTSSGECSRALIEEGVSFLFTHLSSIVGLARDLFG